MRVLHSVPAHDSLTVPQRIFSQRKGPIWLLCFNEQSVSRTYKGSIWGAEGCATRAPLPPFCTPCNWLICDRWTAPACTPGCARGRDEHAGVKGAVWLFHYPSRIHARHEHLKHDVSNYYMRRRLRQQSGCAWLASMSASARLRVLRAATGRGGALIEGLDDPPRPKAAGRAALVESVAFRSYRHSAFLLSASFKARNGLNRGCVVISLISSST